MRAVEFSEVLLWRLSSHCVQRLGRRNVSKAFRVQRTGAGLRDTECDVLGRQCSFRSEQLGGLHWTWEAISGSFGIVCSPELCLLMNFVLYCRGDVLESA